MMTELLMPTQLSDVEVDLCISLIAEGGAVERKFVERYFPRSDRVALIRCGTLIAGVGVIKPPREEYAKKVAIQSSHPFDPSIHELGYVTVHPEHRGQRLSYEIVGALITRYADQPLFATTSSPAIEKALRRGGFERCGVEWKGLRDDPLSLWVRVPPGS